MVKRTVRAATIGIGVIAFLLATGLSGIGSADCLRGVSFGPGHAATFKMKDESTITATVPKGGRKGLTIVTVTTASGEDSKPFLTK